MGNTELLNLQLEEQMVVSLAVLPPNTTISWPPVSNAGNKQMITYLASENCMCVLIMDLFSLQNLLFAPSVPPIIGVLAVPPKSQLSSQIWAYAFVVRSSQTVHYTAGSSRLLLTAPLRGVSWPSYIKEQPAPPIFCYSYSAISFFMALYGTAWHTWHLFY